MQIFATDLDAKAIEQARAGVYPLAIAGDVSPRRLKRFFVQQEHGYQVRKEVREMLVFAPQNLIEDPPFTKLDLLSCRNLLIYLDAALQKRLFPIFHYALKPGGLLFLGSSETLGVFTNCSSRSTRSGVFRGAKGESMEATSAEMPAAVPLELFGGDGAQPSMTSAQAREHDAAHRREGAAARAGAAHRADARARRHRAHPRAHRPVPGARARARRPTPTSSTWRARACSWSWRLRCDRRRASPARWCAATCW